MERFLGAYSSYIYAVMRIVVGLLYACHGAQKLFGVLGGVDRRGASAPLFSLFGLAGIIELVGGLLIVVGLMTGYAAFVASGELATAYFIAHVPRGFWPIQNTGELAVLYCFVFLYIASRGAGAWSVDRARGKS
jgi:putative oxidoreductase